MRRKDVGVDEDVYCVRDTPVVLIEIRTFYELDERTWSALAELVDSNREFWHPAISEKGGSDKATGIVLPVRKPTFHVHCQDIT
jgi:hypothetical protein